MKIEAANKFPFSELLAGDYFILKKQTYQKIDKTSYRNDKTKEVTNIEPTLEAHRTKVQFAYVRNLT